jgi:hypothetical protein
MSESESFELLREFRLEVLGPPDKHLIGLTTQFFGEAMRYFKSLREVRFEARSYVRQYVVGKRPRFCQFEMTGPSFDTKDWKEVAIRSFSNVETLQQIVENYDSYRRQTPTGSWLDEILIALKVRGGHPEAVRLMLKHKIPGLD